MDAPGQVLLRKTTGPDADGEIVWSWRPDAGVKRAERSVRDRSKKARFLGRARIRRKTVVQGRPGDSAFTCGSFPVLFYARGPRVRRAPGLPCALRSKEGHSGSITRARERREKANACFEHSRATSSVVIARERAIRYAAAHRLTHDRLWNTGSPSRARTAQESSSEPRDRHRMLRYARMAARLFFRRSGSIGGHDRRAMERHAGKMRGGEVGRFRCRPQGTFLSFRES